jgi:hypothetical protein
MSLLPGAGVSEGSCVITQLGFIRLSSNPAAVRPFEAARMLATMTQDPAHVFLDGLAARSLSISSRPVDTSR